MRRHGLNKAHNDVDSFNECKSNTKLNKEDSSIDGCIQILRLALSVKEEEEIISDMEAAVENDDAKDSAHESQVLEEER